LGITTRGTQTATFSIGKTPAELGERKLWLVGRGKARGHGVRCQGASVEKNPANGETRKRSRATAFASGGGQKEAGGEAHKMGGREVSGGRE